MVSYFGKEHLAVIDEALRIAEDLASDFFSVTRKQWLSNQYEVCTLVEIKNDIFIEHVEFFAHLFCYGKPFQEKNSGVDNLNFYKIFLNDKRILAHTDRGCYGKLFPFLVYILTHELIHILRFSRYDCCRDVYDRSFEEAMVHDLTDKVLANVKIEGIKQVLNFFKPLKYNYSGGF